jgi:TetR/AcrR family transcriptional regulator, regulator of cefoperazone and chloramphenicol sensitivity
MPRQDHTRDRLIEAAGRLFAEKGRRATTVRDICTKAKANVAAINYHFGGKKRLYAEVLSSIFSYLTSKYPPELGQDQARTTRAKMAAFVRSFLGRMLDPEQPAWHRRLIAREMAEPSPEMRDAVQKVMGRGQCVLRGIVSKILGTAARPEDVEMCMASIAGQCLHYHRRHMISSVMKHIDFSPRGVERLVQHITDFSLGGLRARRKKT